MTQDDVVRGGRPTGHIPVRRLFRAWAGLLKVDSLSIFAAPVAVGLSAVPRAAWAAPGSVPLAGAELAAAACLFVATVVLDDLHGHRDGSDAANYGGPHDFRDPTRKPLLSGLISPRQAARCAYTAWLAGALLWCGVLAAAACRPVAVVALLAALTCCAPQYSWGLRLSYHGWGEALLVYFSVALVLAPAWLGGAPDACRMPSANLLAQAFLVGVWHVTLSSYANSADVVGDRAGGRATAATALGPRGNRGYLAALATSDLLLTLTVIGTSPAPWWSAAVLTPLAAVRTAAARSYRTTRDARAAHRHFWHLYRLGWPVLAVLNISTG